jgi:hypothetical protein
MVWVSVKVSSERILVLLCCQDAFEERREITDPACPSLQAVSHFLAAQEQFDQ